MTRTLANPALWSRIRIAVLFDVDRSPLSVVTIQPRKYWPGGTEFGICTLREPLHQLVKVFQVKEPISWSLVVMTSFVER